MKLSLQITSRNFGIPRAYRDEIREKAGKLDRYYDRIMRCRVVVAMPHRHKHEGVLYNVHIYMTVAGGEIVIKREPNEDLSVAIRDAFDAARRRLEDFARAQRGDIKRHQEEKNRARISRIFPARGYGFLSTPDGREIYFHEHSVLNRDFRRLKIGMEVLFVEEQGDKGAQASTVTVAKA